MVVVGHPSENLAETVPPALLGGAFPATMTALKGQVTSMKVQNDSIKGCRQLPWNVKAVLDEQKKKSQERSQPSAA
jgi:hypothetical protein